MAKNLLVIGIGKQPSMPPRFGARKERDEYQPAAEPPPEPPAPSGESPEFEQEAHDLAPGSKFPPANVHYHTAADECQGCHHWDESAASCKVVAMATDPGGWCSLFPGEYAEDESSESNETPDPDAALDEVAA